MSATTDPREKAGTSMAERAAAGAGPSEIPDALTYRVVLPDFEGPLDLLLYLCKSHEIDILEIPISFVTQKYLEYLDLMQSLSVEVAAEYLVMAATLAYLKSRELVPQPEPLEAQSDDGDDVGDPKEELIRRLLEYQKYKNAAEQLGLRPIEGKNVFGRGLPIELEKGPEELAEHSPWKLIEHFASLLQQNEPEHTHDVVIDRMSVAQRINQLIDMLEAGDGSFRFDSLIDFAAPMVEVRHQVVVTLLAVLELAKLKAIRVLQDPVSETFFVARAAASSDDVLRAARKAMTTSDGAAHEDPEAAATEAAGEAPEAAATEAAEETQYAAVTEAAEETPDAAVAEPAEEAPYAAVAEPAEETPVAAEASAEETEAALVETATHDSPIDVSGDHDGKA